MYKATVEITLRPSILDPQGKAAHHALDHLGYHSIERVRIGKHVEIWITEDREEVAEQVAREACERLLANPVMEDYSIRLDRVDRD